MASSSTATADHTYSTSLPVAVANTLSQLPSTVDMVDVVEDPPFNTVSTAESRIADWGEKLRALSNENGVFVAENEA